MSCILADDPLLSDEERNAFEVHRMLCVSCAKEFEDTKALFGVVSTHWGPLSEQTKNLLAARGQNSPTKANQRPMTVHQGWADLQRRLPELAQLDHRQQNTQKRRQLVYRIGSVAALAACLAMAILIGWSVLAGRSQKGSGGSLAGVTNPAERFYAEIVTATARQPVALGKPLTTAQQRQEILLGGMHRVVMNHDTQSTITVGGEGAKKRYEIQLTKGELYVEVVPGHPFAVKAGNALLNITGTKFDVRTEGDRTDLVLVKGSVRFSRHDMQQAAVNVVAGQASTVSGRSPPTSPQPVDALAATAWATDVALRNVIARIAPEAEEDLTRLTERAERRSAGRAPESLDYATWRDEHREWFGREFPWIFKAHAALSQERKVDADYIDLLMISGDVWQFRYDPTRAPLNQPIAMFDPAGMQRLAKHFGVDERWMLQAAGSGRTNAAAGADSSRDSLAYVSALKRWRADIRVGEQIRGKPADDVLLFSLRASAYLAQTRTAAYLWVRNYPQKAEQLRLSDPHAAQCLVVLTGAAAAQQVNPRGLAAQLTASYRGSQTAQALLMTPPSPSCASESTTLWREFSEVVSDMVPEDRPATQSIGGESSDRAKPANPG